MFFSISAATLNNIVFCRHQMIYGASHQ